MRSEQYVLSYAGSGAHPGGTHTRIRCASTGVLSEESAGDVASRRHGLRHPLPIGMGISPAQGRSCLNRGPLLERTEWRSSPPTYPPQAEDRLKRLKFNRIRMVEYLKLKMEEEDWHGVQDAGSDLRDIESEIKGIEFMRGLRNVPD